jgi:hypothetical protein
MSLTVVFVLAHSLRCLVLAHAKRGSRSLFTERFRLSCDVLPGRWVGAIYSYEHVCWQRRCAATSTTTAFGLQFAMTVSDAHDGSCSCLWNSSRIISQSPSAWYGEGSRVRLCRLHDEPMTRASFIAFWLAHANLEHVVEAAVPVGIGGAVDSVARITQHENV